MARQARGPSAAARQARGPSAAARQARGPSTAARQARGPSAAAREPSAAARVHSSLLGGGRVLKFLILKKKFLRGIYQIMINITIN